MQTIRTSNHIDDLNRRTFFKIMCAAAAGALMPRDLWSMEGTSQINLAQIVYSGGNWQPRPTALRRLAWEIHKRTSINISLDPGHIKPNTNALSTNPIAYLSGDRSFSKWEQAAVEGLRRFLRLGGTLIVDPAYTVNGDAAAFSSSVKDLMTLVLPDSPLEKIQPGHVVFRSFYNLSKAVGRTKGPDYLQGYTIEKRVAVIQGDHDFAGAWARDNLGNWEHEVTPGGERQRENAFRLGVNLIMYALCQDYKNEQPHRRFGRSTKEAK